MRERLVQRRLRVAPPLRPREPGAGRGEGGKAETGEHVGAADVPGVGNDEAPGLVELAKAAYAIGGVRHGGERKHSIVAQCTVVSSTAHRSTTEGAHATLGEDCGRCLDARPGRCEPGSCPAEKRRLHPHRRPSLRRDGLQGPSHRPRRPTSTASPRDGAHFRNAFVTTALCSPSRATILTGLYAHQHRVVDNNTPIPPGTTFFPQYLQTAGYQTAFIGKWHMGDDDGGPQPGFDHWVSFRGQGTYLPTKDGLNVDGKRVPQKGYITDELTDYALDWLRRATGRSRSSCTCRTRPCTRLRPATRSSDFIPAERHAGRSRTAASRRRRARAARRSSGARPRWVREPAQQLARRRLPVSRHARHRRVLQALRRDAHGRGRQRRPRARLPGSREGCSIRRSSSTWATTASPSASTG